VTVPLVLRDLAACALSKQVVAVTAEQLADVLAPFGCGDISQIRKALRQLEAQGLAARQPGWRPQGGRAPDLWTSR
jgi:predicted ArsR family transcriptional regulator